MALISIGGVELPGLYKYEVGKADIDSENTKRTETGLLVRDRVRAGVYKIEAGFRVTTTQLKTITDAISPASFSVTFFDPTSSANVTKTMYAGDKKAELVHYNNSVPNNSLWELSVSLVEY